MSLNSMLDRLENVTLVTSSHTASVTPKRTPHRVVPRVTAVTFKEPILENLEITPEQESAIRAWLFSIEEPEEDHHIVIDKCKLDSEALDYFMKWVEQSASSANQFVGKNHAKR